MKKLLSFALAMLLALSCFSTGLVAFAADHDLKESTTETVSVPPTEAESPKEPPVNLPEDGTHAKNPNQDKNIRKELESAFADLAGALSEVLVSGIPAEPEKENPESVSKSTLEEFLTTMEKVTEPYDNEDIALVKPLYDKLSVFDLLKVSKEVKEKYKAILASIGPNVPQKNQPDLSVYKQTVITYPNHVSHQKVENALPKLEEFVKNTLLLVNQKQDLPTVINQKLYTNENVAKLCQKLFPELEKLTSLLKVSPTNLANSLTEEKFAGAKEGLSNAGKDWSAFTVSNGDFGFQDGDKEGFMDAVAAIFRPLSMITLILPLENTINTNKGTYTYGAYEDFIPVFEMLDAKGVLPSHEYTLQVKEANKINTNAAMDARIRPILVPIFNLVDAFAKEPVNTVLTVLPKLGYAIDSELLSTQIGKLLAKMKLVSIPAPDLSAKGFFALISPALKEIDANGIKLSFLQDETAFVKFIKEIGGCGVAVSKKSIAFDNMYRLGIAADTSESFVVTFRFLYNEISSPFNIKSLREAVASNPNLTSIERFAAEQILNQMEKTSADKAMATFLNVLSPDPPKFTLLGTLQNIIAKLFSDVGNLLAPEGFLGVLGSFLGSIFGGSGGGVVTDTPEIPQTGNKRILAWIPLALIAVAAASGILIYKKKK